MSEQLLPILPLQETYSVEEGYVVRESTLGSENVRTRMEDISGLPSDASSWSRWWRSFLRGGKTALLTTPRGNLTIVDLFCGYGGLTLGASEAARAVGFLPRVLAAVDMDAKGLEVYAANFAPDFTLCRDVGQLVRFHVNGWGKTASFVEQPVLLDEQLAKLAGEVDLVVAGPPCQGHSTLNNHTRHADPRNFLYLDAVAVAVGLEARAIVIENVPGVVVDRYRVTETAFSLLTNAGYKITKATLAADALGWPQTRKRFFLVAARSSLVDLSLLAESLAKPACTVQWAIEDILDSYEDPPLDRAPELSDENRRRIDFLFDNDLYDLPDQMRPKCHRNGHTYPAVYGRLRWDAPAGTITTGFLSPGRGRFIHPLRRRTLTPREAARLQGFPDWFQFTPESGEYGKTDIARWIGNAVPPILGYTATLAALI